MNTEPITNKKIIKHSDSVNSVAFSPNGKLLASSSFDKDEAIIIWDTDTDRKQNIPTDSAGGFVQNLSFSSDGKRLISSISNDIHDSDKKVAWILDVDNNWKSIEFKKYKQYIEIYDDTNMRNIEKAKKNYSDYRYINSACGY